MLKPEITDLQKGATGTVEAHTTAQQPGDSGTSLGALSSFQGPRESLTAVPSVSPDTKVEGLLPSVVISTENAATGFAKGLGQSFLYSLVQSPLEGLSETFDHTLGKVGGSNLYAKTKDLVVAAPKPAEFGSAEWHGQSIGGALGIIPWFFATRGALRGGAGLCQATEGLVVTEAEAAAAGKVFSKTGAKLMLESGTTAAVYASIFKPVGSGEGYYWAAKSGQMTSDFATFATLTASSTYVSTELKTLAVPLLEKYPGASQLTQRATSMLAGGLSGIPAAAVGSAFQFAQSGGSTGLSLNEFGKNAYSFAVVGASLSAAHPLSAKTPEGHSAKTPEVKTSPQSEQVLPAQTAQAGPTAQNEAVHANLAGASAIQTSANGADGAPAITEQAGLTAKNKYGLKMAEGLSLWNLAANANFDTAIKSASGKATFHRWPSPGIDVVRTEGLVKDLYALPNASDFMEVIGTRSVGRLPQPFLSTGLEEKAVFEKLDSLAKALRSLDTSLPPQKKTGLGAYDLDLPSFSVGLGNDQIAVSKVGIGEVAHVYKLTIGGQDYAFKVPNDPARTDVHGTYFETGAFVYLSKEKISDLIDFHAATPGPSGGWILTEFVDKPVERSGRPIANVLADQGLRLGDDWSANRGPGNVVWDLGGIEPKGVMKPRSIDELVELLQSRQGLMIAGRKLDGIKDQETLKRALLISLDRPSIGGQVARTAAKYLVNPADLAQVLNKALETSGAAGRAAFELDYLANTPFITDVFYKALKNPESRVEAAKQIDKLPPQERKAAFDAAFVYPDARAMATRSIPSIPDEAGRLEATAKAEAFPGSNFVQYHSLSKVRSLTDSELSAQQRAFEQYFDSFTLATGSKLTEAPPEATFDQWLKSLESNLDGKKIDTNLAQGLRNIWGDLNDSQRALPAEALWDLAECWSGLKPAQWRTLTGAETVPFVRLITNFGADSPIPERIFEKPALNDWFSQHPDTRSNDAENVIEMWDKIPAQFKQLDGPTLTYISFAWDRMKASDWATIPAESAYDVAATISILNLYPDYSQYLAKNPDFAKWFQFNEAGIHVPAPSLLTTLRMWDRLTPEQKTMPLFEIARQAYCLETAVKLENEFGKDSTVFRYLRSLETTANSPSHIVVEWLDEVRQVQSAQVKEQAKAMVEKLVGSGATAVDFGPRSLYNRLYMDLYFGDKPEFQARLTQQFPNPLSLGTVLEFVRKNESINKPIVEMAVEQGFTGNDDEWSNLRAAATTISRVGVDSSGARHLLKLQSQGLRLTELATYMGENPKSVPQIKDLVEKQADRTQLDARKLADRDNLSRLHGFSEQDLEQLGALQWQGLSITRLLNHLKDKPSDITAFQALLGQGAEVKQINDFMQLSVFPSAIDLRLVDAAKKGEITTEDVLAKTRDWSSGRHFRDLLITHVENGATLSATNLERLHYRAVGLAGKGAAHSPLQPDPYQLQRVPEAATFVDAMRGIEKSIPADKPIVLLGRDAWPLLPLLRLAGRDVHYFLWSRLQNGDAGTRRQWLREVPPNAAVVDSGFSGSIIDKIKTLDPGVSGYLMSSNVPHQYPTLMSNANHCELVGQIEGLPKLIYRSRSHTSRGGAVSRKNANSGDGDTKETWEEQSRWYVERRSRELLRATGLPQWDIWRYSQFVGLTPMERLGLNTKEQVEQHYQTILGLRTPDASTK